MNSIHPLGSAPNPRGLLLALGLFLAACSSKPAWYEGAQVTPIEIGQTKNLSSFGGHVYLAGQPSAEDLKAFSQRGVKTVINLRTEEEMKQIGFDEKAATEAAGMKYLNVPISRDEPSEAQLEQIFTILDGSKDAPALLHCGSANRVGYVWSMFRGARQGLAPDAAIQEGKQAGLRTPELEERSRRFLQRKAGP